MKSHRSLHRTPRVILVSVLFALTLGATGAVVPGAFAGDDEWRPVEPSELAMKVPVVEPDADAEAIFWDIRVNDSGASDLVLQHYIRIKIFTDRGREKEAKIDIPFLTGTKIKDVAARTIKPDGSIVELGKEEVFERVIVKVSGVKLRTKSFAFPAIEVGSIIEYKWKEVISNASANNMRLQFQREIPVQAITYHIKPANSSTSFSVYPFNMVPPEFQKEKDGFRFLTVTKTPAFHEEPVMPPEDSVRSWGLLKYQNLFSLLGYQLMAAGLNTGFKPLLKVDDEIERKSAEIVAGVVTPEEKLTRIFAFCRTNIKNTYDQSSTGLTAEEIDKLKANKKPADTLKRGIGSGFDINLLFAALANAAGLEAHMALVPDRGKNFFNRSVVVPGSLSPSNVAVRVGSSWRFFDPGFHYIPADMLRWQEEGVEALIVSDVSPWVKTPISPADKSRETRVATLRLDEDGTLEGDVSVDYTGHLGVSRKALNDDDSPNAREENLKEALKNRMSTAELTNIVIENVTDPVKPILYKYHVRVPGYAQRTGKRLFLQPAFFQKGIPAFFAASTRRYSIYFHHAWSEADKVEITLPKGYVLDNADTPAPIRAGATCYYEVKMGVSKDQSLLVYTRSFFFGGNMLLLFPAENYPQLKQLFDEISKSDNHTITLKQAGTAN